MYHAAAIAGVFVFTIILLTFYDKRALRIKREIYAEQQALRARVDTVDQIASRKINGLQAHVYHQGTTNAHVQKEINHLRRLIITKPEKKNFFVRIKANRSTD